MISNSRFKISPVTLLFLIQGKTTFLNFLFYAFNTPLQVNVSFVCFRRGDGQTLLSQMHGRLHTQILSPPSHRRSLLRHRLPTHALHGSPGVSPQAARKPVCTEVLFYFSPNIRFLTTQNNLLIAVVHLLGRLNCPKLTSIFIFETIDKLF